MYVIITIFLMWISYNVGKGVGSDEMDKKCTLHHYPKRYKEVYGFTEEEERKYGHLVADDDEGQEEETNKEQQEDP